MNCKHAELGIAEYVAGRLAARDVVEFEQHLAICPNCARLLARVQEISRLPGLRETPELAPADCAKLLAKLFGPNATAVPAHVGTRRVAAMRAALWVVGLTLAAYGSWSLLSSKRLAEHERLALAPLSIELPAFPTAYAEDRWLSSKAEAEALALYTGRPVLEEYTNPWCPRCTGMEQVTQSAEQQVKLREFVLLRGTIESEPPTWVLDKLPVDEIPYRLPAMRITRADCATAVASEMVNGAALDALVAEWRARCEAARSSGAHAPLPRADFEAVVATLMQLPTVASGTRYADALQLLDRALARCAKFDTAFVRDIDRLRAALTTQIDAQLAEIEALCAGKTRLEKLRGRDLARQLLERCAGLPHASRLALLASR
ncbi:MAG: zf-HC2 domain-containing protein [Planctomycetota bacterium]